MTVACKAPAANARVQKLVAEFGRPGGVAQELQQRLIARSKSEPIGWFIEWWNDLAYQSYRDPLVINVSYFFQFIDDKVFTTQTSRAAAIAQAALEYRRMIMTYVPACMLGMPISDTLGRSRELPAETTKEGPLCMLTYDYMFNTTRQALPKTDYTQHFSYESNPHITVMRKNRIFSFPVYEAGSKRTLPTAKLERLFQKVVAIADAAPANDREAIGLISTENRDEAAKLREIILGSHPLNAETLHHLEASIFTVCLDDTTPVNRNDVRDSFLPFRNLTFLRRLAALCGTATAATATLTSLSSLSSLPTARPA